MGTGFCCVLDVADAPQALSLLRARYPSAQELAQALDGCRELHRVAKSLPPAGPITRAGKP